MLKSIKKINKKFVKKSVIKIMKINKLNCKTINKIINKIINKKINKKFVKKTENP